MKNAIIYTRISEEEQSQYSLSDQKQKIETYCNQRDINVLKHFEEDGGSGKSFNRKAFQELLLYIKANKGIVNKLIVTRYDRFSRDLIGALNMILELKELGVNVVAVEQPLDENVPESLIMKAIYLATPNVENLRRAMNAANSMRRALKEGRYMGKAPYGYMNARNIANKAIIVPHPVKAGHVMKAFKMISTGTWQIEVLRKQLLKEGMKVSRSNFYNLLRNITYYGKGMVKANQEEEEQIVQGIHEPIISEELFFDVQAVLDGKKRNNTKHSITNEAYPLKGYFVCPKCGKGLTGDTGKGNGGAYDYYRCKHGCKQSYRASFINSEFIKWLGKIAIDPDVASLYIAIMEDIFKTNEGDRNAEIGKLQKQIDENELMMDKSAKKFVNDDLDRNDYKRIKESLSRECTELRSRIAELKGAESGFQEYYRYGLSLLSNMGSYYNAANIENRQKMLGLIFPEKLVFSNNTFQTMQPSEVLNLLCNGGKGFSKDKKEKSSGNAAQSCLVTPPGFKPGTF